MPSTTPPRTLVLVAGSGRSGTSLLSGILQRVGLHVPQPEVAADDSNPKGFAESQWVVDFHDGLLRRAGVQVADGRPAAWAATARTALQPEAERDLGAWLEAQLEAHHGLVVKDPRLSWFLPLWRRCGAAAGARACFVTMLRHPAAVVDSKQRWYGGRQGEPARAAGWLNQTLYTERATRGAARAFVRYEDLLEDWPRQLGRVAEALDLAEVRDASAMAIRQVHGFVDAGLSRSRSSWDGLRVPVALQEQADATWEVLSALAADTAPADATARLDVIRERYAAYYADAEAVAASSIAAASRAERRAAQPALPAPARRAIGLVPARVKRQLPPAVRARVVRTLAGA